MNQHYDMHCTVYEMEALRTAARLGAFAARADQLRSVIDNEARQGYGQLADNAQQELRDLNAGVEALLNAKVKEPLR